MASHRTSSFHNNALKIAIINTNHTQIARIQAVKHNPYILIEMEEHVTILKLDLLSREIHSKLTTNELKVKATQPLLVF